MWRNTLTRNEKKYLMHNPLKLWNNNERLKTEYAGKEDYEILCYFVLKNDFPWILIML